MQHEYEELTGKAGEVDELRRRELVAKLMRNSAEAMFHQAPARPGRPGGAKRRAKRKAQKAARRSNRKR